MLRNGGEDSMEGLAESSPENSNMWDSNDSRPMSTLPTGTVTYLFTDIEGSTRLLHDLGDRYAEVLAAHHRILRSAFDAFGGREVESHGDGFFAAFPRARDAVAASIAAQRAIAAHSWPEGKMVRVRMGLDTGEPLDAETGYVDIHIHRAARICAAGWGGQILISQATRELVADDLPIGTSLRDLREHRLKDLASPIRVYQVVVTDVPCDFPSLRSLTSLPNNLPLQLTSFIGREREMGEIKALLSRSRLLTLVGSGGSGKTRLALQVAAELLEESKDGVWLVELAALTDAGLLAQTVAAALNLREQPGRTVEATLTDYLEPRQILLVLDNCEHLLSACAELGEGLLRTCPRLHLLATSRESLAISGELTYRVPSLAVAELRRLTSVDALIQNEAVRLFVDRATLAAPAFRLTERNAAVVAQICDRLDGIPLAIELAAGRMKGMSVEQIAARLDDRFRLLTGGSRTALPRQQTLRAAMDWSYEMLSDPERIVLRRLSVFVGGWTLEATEAVCAGDGLEPSDVLDLVMHLLDKSLVFMEDSDGEARYRFLETIRQYARDKLVEAGEANRVRDRHRDWCLELAEQAEPHLTGPAQPVWFERLEVEHPNLRAGLEWCKTGDNATEKGMRLAAPLWRFWNVRGYWSEGREWLEGALARAGNASPAVRLKALSGAGVLVWNRDESAMMLLEESLALARELGDKRAIADALRLLARPVREQLDYDRVRALGEESLRLFRELHDPAGISVALRVLGVHARDYHEYERAIPALDESLKLARALQDRRGVVWSLTNLAIVAGEQGDYAKGVTIGNEALSTAQNLGDKLGMADSLHTLGRIAGYRGDHEQAAGLLEEALRLIKELGSKADHANVLRSLGLVAQDQGDYERAKRLHEECVALLEETGDRWTRVRTTLIHADALRALGVIALHEGDFTRARALLEKSLAFFGETRNRRLAAQALDDLGAVARRDSDAQRARALHQEALALRRDMGDKRGIAESLEGLAAVAVSQQQFDRAAALFGAAQAQRVAIGAPLPPAERPDYEESVTDTRSGLGKKTFREAWARGRDMKLEEAVALGLQNDAKVSQPPRGHSA